MYTLQTRKSDTLQATMAAGATSATLTNGAFGTPTGKQIITIDYDVAAKAADFEVTLAGTAITEMVLKNGPDVQHEAGAKVAMCFVDEHYGDLGKIAASDPWTAYTPTATPDSGSITGFTVLAARYLKIGRLVSVKICGYGTQAGSNGFGWNITLPVTASSEFDSMRMPTMVKSGDTPGVGSFYFVTPYNKVLVTPQIGGGTYTVGTAYQIVLNFTYESAA